ncbi:UDP-2,3-diacylglucosamine hydrolase [Paracandidimonas soli]|uniref:UDP-2,3-diacylglucosamine hydrolase n=1 Tax=Paracandidimonas soli TaxID=1917182 RepID=A0A4R3URG7_9BURK|nr:UDP-2,3-diacylglucosamine diphosphatase [Paracandidimonas soli]TCU94515.1 UDP-2,3-diacylglucosamine hydrolase [Paracandidimonas soli]
MFPRKPSSSKKPSLRNKLNTPGTLWIASDIHLSDAHPETRRAFLSFLDKASSQADALFLCGDIFDVWIGDDLAIEDPPPWLAEIVQALRRTASRMPLWLGRGNRDFLMGEALAAHIGARLLPDAVILATDAGDVLLTHGDQYCTDDASYQRFRKLVRCRAIQWLFMQLSLSARRGIADWARKRSMASNTFKSQYVMDVNQDAVIQAFRRSGVSQMVHGHTHRPAVHIVEVDGRRCLRHVLPDWEPCAEPMRGGWLRIDGNGLHAVSLADGAL